MPLKHKRSLRLFVANSRGSSLLVVMGALGFAGLVSWTMSEKFRNTNKEQSLQQIEQQRHYVVEQVTRVISTATVLYTSAINPNNTNLSVCVRGGGGRCQALREQILEAYSPIGQNGAPFRISGSPTGVQAYDLMGNPCATLSTACPFYLQTIFRAICSGGAANCPVAQDIEVRAELIQSPQFPLAKSYGGKVFPPAPKDRTTFSKMSVSEIMASVFQRCNANSVMIGTDTAGKIVCKCLAGFIQSGQSPDTGFPICTSRDSRCTDDQILVGIAADGRAECQTPVRNSVCRTVTVPRGSGINCGNQGQGKIRLVRNYNSCELRQVGGQRSRNAEVFCQPIEALCCTGE